MKVVILLIVVTIAVRWLECVRLDPLENNDKLEQVRTQYVAEWQWESWPRKLGSSPGESPGARHSAALWLDPVAATWYLFGGQPVHSDQGKQYSDIWRYSIPARTWERVFPSQSEGKDKSFSKIGGMMTLRANLFDDVYYRKSLVSQNPSVVLCGRVTKRQPERTTVKSPYNFARRKKQDLMQKTEESKSLAVYGPKTTRSNTVWQIDLKDKLWTQYVCCCDSTNGSYNKTVRNNDTKRINQTGEETNVSIDKMEEKIELEQQHMTVSPISQSKWKKKASEIKKKKKKAERNNFEPVVEEQREGVTLTQGQGVDVVNNMRTIHIFEDLQVFPNQSVSPEKMVAVPKNKTFIVVEDPKITVDVRADNATKDTGEGSNATHEGPVLRKMKSQDWNVTQPLNDSRPAINTTGTVPPRPKLASKYCPDFSEEGQPVSWCDGEGDTLNTLDVSTPHMMLWSFDLRTSHWSQNEMAVPREWTGCSDPLDLRYVGDGSQVFVFCNLDVNDTRQVFRVDGERRVMEHLGGIDLPPLFGTPEGRELWASDTRAILQVVRTASNDTILVLAYEDDIDIWILTSEGFEPVQKLWRGSALKWFKKYNAPWYNLQFATEDSGPETLLTANPRDIAPNEHWPNERGRFIIRIFKNENLKSRNFENRTRDQNLTFEHLQSESPGAGESSAAHGSGGKLAIVLGVSLAVFAIFGAAVLAKRCVKCPPIRVPITNRDCQKSPPIIRYSVIPDDLMYPIT